MIKRKSFPVLVRQRDMEKLIRSVIPSARAFKITARPKLISSSTSLVSLSYEVEGEELKIEAFRKLVQSSALTYKPKP